MTDYDPMMVDELKVLSVTFKYYFFQFILPLIHCLYIGNSNIDDTKTSLIIVIQAIVSKS